MASPTDPAPLTERRRSRAVPTPVVGEVALRPPFQVHGCRMVYVAGHLPGTTVRNLLPAGLMPAPGNICILGFYDAPFGWGIAPFAAFYAGIAVEGHDSPDGSEAVYNVAGRFSGRAGEIVPALQNRNIVAGEIDFALTESHASCHALIDAGDGYVRVSARPGPAPAIWDSGTSVYLGRGEPGEIMKWAVAYSTRYTTTTDVTVEVVLPGGHRLTGLEAFRPDWALYTTEGTFTFGPVETIGIPMAEDASRLALLNLLSCTGRAVALLEPSGRIAFLTREAEVILKDDAGTGLTRLPATITRTALGNPLADPMRQPALLTLASGRQMAARAFPIALRVGAGPLAMVLLTDPRTPGQTDPEPLLRLMGLTPSEAALAALVGQGRSPAEAARARGITQSTARSMLKSVYQKLGLSRQAELAVLVTRLQSA